MSPILPPRVRQKEGQGSKEHEQHGGEGSKKRMERRSKKFVQKRISILKLRLGPQNEKIKHLPDPATGEAMGEQKRRDFEIGEHQRNDIAYEAISSNPRRLEGGRPAALQRR